MDEDGHPGHWITGIVELIVFLPIMFLLVVSLLNKQDFSKLLEMRDEARCRQF